MTDPVIRIRGLENRFGSHVVHEGLDLDVRRGEVLGVAGGSGTGKSVLLRSIVGLQTPTAGLDPIGALAFDRLMRELVAALGLTVFLVTHDLDTLHALCDRIAVLAERRVLACGTMDDMLEVDHPWVRDYFHGPRGRAARGLPPLDPDRS
ncbi:ATP-binding cassette domain-containing protein [Limimaricola cinnabarinus]|uniref:ABC transporter ATP-binding protein USSDB6B n=1 Tax=Limimaricola cinnabarinus LL-001 TaxID=1337093 RepID=U3AI31_9RHOB|nr:ATP-binding cassette domain-containing protein [Limimaricola cinnabarinus]GAD57319.1 ABC transporter ATP-binding protein USSDB6B [Limimaricola cinnabarinus LL-001]